MTALEPTGTDPYYWNGDADRNIVNWHDEWNDIDHETRWIIPGLVGQASYVSLTAAAETGKSLLALYATTRLALGETLFDDEPLPLARTLYIDKEMSTRQAKKRMMSFGYTQDSVRTLTDYFKYHRDSHLFRPLDTPQGGKQFVEYVKDCAVDVIVLDTVSQFVAGKEDSSDTWRAMFDYSIQPVVRGLGVSILQLDHTGWNTGSHERGSSAKRDKVDSAWLMTRTKERLTLKSVKDRDGHGWKQIDLVQHEVPTSFKYHGSPNLADSIDDIHEELSDAKARIIVAMDEHGLTSLGRNAAQKQLRERGVHILAGTDVWSAAVRERKQRDNRLR